MITLIILILSIALLLQFTAAFFAFRLIRITGKRMAWILISIGIFLMAIRRCIPLFKIISGNISYLPDITNEFIGLIISILMVSGAAWIAPLFLSIKRSEDALRESREWLFTTLKSIGDAVIATNTKGSITFMNQTAQILTCRTEEESIGKPLKQVFTIVDEKTGQLKEDPVIKVIQTRDIVELDNQTQLVNKNGIKISIDDSAAPIKNEKGDIIGTVLIFRDITERKRAQQEIKYAHRELNQIFNTAADGMRVINRDFKVIRINEKFLKMVNMTKDKVIGQKCYEVYPGTYCHTPNCSMKKILAGVGYLEHDVEKELPDGNKMTCIMTATPLRRPDGELIGIVENFRDITERKQAEEALRQSKAAKEERQRLFSVLDVLPAIVYLQSTDYSIPFANRTFRKLFGDPKGKHCYEIIHDLKKPCEECRMSCVLDKKNIQKWELTSSEGKTYEMYDNLFTDIDGSLMVLELGINITDRIRMEKARKEAEHKLEKQRAIAILSDRLRSLGEMATGMAHELNQPLLGIRGLAEHILIGFKRGWNISEETIREKIRLIIEQTERMTHVIEHARMFARGADNCELLPVQINEVIKSSLDLIGVQLRFRGLTLNCELADNLPTVLANPFSLEEVIMNLINNARDAIMERMKNSTINSPQLIIRTFREKSGHDGPVKIEIIDHGVGIPQDLMPKVFEPFFTTKEPDKGTGLGLALSKSIIEKFEGTINIRSTPGLGATVIITLPAMIQN